ncbi:MAG TPA: hypothetical protein DDZ58_03100, partial [Achromobacter sp.]|nr:hypothetical protein [Achromobacter sp.]
MLVLAEIIKKIRDTEAEILSRSPVLHAPTIGAMYEGLTESLLSKFELKKFNIKVCSGFVTTGGKTSGQMDCMVVIGDGEPVRHTDLFCYPIDRVVAVIEVKKQMLGGEIDDSYTHLNEINDLTMKDLEERQRQGVLSFDTQRAAEEYFNIFGSWPPKFSEYKSLEPVRRAIYYTLVREHLTPLRIAFGYYGYKSQKHFRRGVANLLTGNAGVRGYGVLNMPSLIVSDGFSAVKSNGLPYKGG